MNTLSECLRQLSNLVRFGVVAHIDHASARVRIQSGENLTDWLPWLTLRAANVATWNPPTLGEQVLLLSPQGELNQAVAITGLYSEQFPPPNNQADEIHTHYPDGTSTTYNHVEKQLTVVLAGNASLTIEGEVNAQINGKLTATVGGKAEITTSDTTQITASAIHLNGGAGVVTGNHICPYTGAPHAHVSSTVTAGE